MSDIDSNLNSVFDQALAGSTPSNISEPSTLSDVFDKLVSTPINLIKGVATYPQKIARDIVTPDNPQAQMGYGPNQGLEFERSPNYPSSTYTDPTVTDVWNAYAAGNVAKDIAETGLVGIGEAVQNIRGTPTAPVEVPKLPFGDVVDTTAVETNLGKVFDEAVNAAKPEPTNLTEVFERNAPSISPSESVAPVMDERFMEPGAIQRTLAKSEADILKPETLVSPYTGKPLIPYSQSKYAQPELAGVGSESGQVINPAELKQKLIDEPFDISGQYSEIQASKAEYLGNLQERLFNAQLAIRDITKNLTPAESEAMPFVAEGGSLPQKWLSDPSKAEIVTLIQNPSPAMQESLTKYQAFRDQYAKELSIHVPEFNERTDYMPHILEAPTELQAGRTGKVTGATPFVKQRALANLGEAIDLGYVKKYSDFSKDLTAYSGSVEKALAQKQFANYITKARDVNNEPFAYPKFIKQADGRYVPNKDLPAVVKNGAELTPLLKDHYVTPEIYEQLKFMRGLEQPGNFARAYDMTAAAVKKAMLSLSFFHHITLSESGIAMGVLGKTLKALPASYRAGGAEFLNPELTRDALKHNLVIGHGVVDVKQGLIGEFAAKADQAINYALSKIMESPNLDAKYVARILKPAAKLEEIWDAALWNHYQPTLKLMAYEQNVATLLGKKEFAHIPIDVLKRQVADEVNNFFGGQPWELIFNDPKMKQALNRSLLALDWTASNIRIPLSFPSAGAKGYVARKAWLKMALLFLGSTEALNLINTKIQKGQAEFTDANDKGHKFDVWLYKDKSGMNHYMTVNKGFVEPFRWLTHPVKELRNKINPVVQMLFEQMSGHTMAGYDLDFAKPGNRLKAITDKVVPFSMGGGTFLGALPVSQGISITSLKQDLETAIYKNDTDKIQELLKTAANNGIDGMRIYNQVRQQIKRSEKYEQKNKNKPSPTSEVVQRINPFGTLGSAYSEDFQSIVDKVRNYYKGKK